MFGRGEKKCELCKIKIDKPIEAEVEIYGKVGRFKKYFCSEEHLKMHIKRTEELMKTRRCMSCHLK